MLLNTRSMYFLRSRGCYGGRFCIATTYLTEMQARDLNQTLVTIWSTISGYSFA